MTDDIDIIAAALSGDRRAVYIDQLKRIETELIARLAVNITTRETIHNLLHEIRNDLLRLEAPHDGLGDDPSTLTDRIVLKREWRQLVRSLAEEQRSCWADTQALKSEARIVEKELLTLAHRDRRRGEFA